MSAAVIDKRELTDGERRRAGCGCALLFGLGLLAALGTVDGGMCKTTTFVRSVSPDGFTGARVQMTDCGATTGFSRVVWVQPRWLPQDRWLSCRAVALDGMEAVSLTWVGDSLRVASTAPRSSVIGVADSCNGWKIDLRLRR